MGSALNTSDRWVLVIGGLIAVAGGVWVVNSPGAAMLWFYVVLITALLALALVPIGVGYGRKGEAAFLVSTALIIGPFALFAIVPWVRGLPGRARDIER
jgi:hypothetical protein